MRVRRAEIFNANIKYSIVALLGEFQKRKEALSSLHRSSATGKLQK